MGFYGKRLAAFVFVPLVALGTACSSDDDKGDKAGNAAQSPAANSPAPSSAAASDAKRLTAEQLKAALVTSAELPGYEVATGSPEDDGTGVETSDKPECQPLLQLIAADKEHMPNESASAGATKADNSSKTTYWLALGQFDGDKAEKLISEVQDSLTKCTSQFVGTDEEGTKTEYTIQDSKKLGYGDDSLTITYGMDGEPWTLSFVRSGPVIAQGTAISFDLEDTAPADPVMPEEMMRAQYDKLVKAQKG
ncbi:sensor domain-containing protein [Streptomycetaceae bacterium NBC_01309]